MNDTLALAIAGVAALLWLALVFVLLLRRMNRLEREHRLLDADLSMVLMIMAGCVCVPPAIYVALLWVLTERL